MSFLDKFLNVMRLNPDDDDDFYNEDYDYDDEEEEVKPKSSFKKREKEDTFTDDYKEKPVKTTPKVTPIRPSKKQQNLAGMEVCVIKPTSVEDAREITETLLANRTVVLNLEGRTWISPSVSLTLLPDPVSQYRVIYRKYPIIFSLLRRPA